MKGRVLYVLQNAWRRSAQEGEITTGREAAWERLLWRSQTGKRLKEMIPAGIPFRVMNASPLVGNHSKSRFQASLEHVWHQVVEYRPMVVVLLGTEAAKLEKQLPGPQIVVGPHPCWRRWSN